METSMEIRQKKNITVVGAGYVGLSIATMLSKYHSVTVLDVLPDKVEKINKRIPTICDDYIKWYFAGDFGQIDLTATTDPESAYKMADFIIIAVPTNYDPDKNRFDIGCVDHVVEDILNFNKSAVIVIKSTVPIGYTENLYKNYGGDINILFSPEFLQEGTALADCLYPSRIVIGVPANRNDLVMAAKIFSELLRDAADMDANHIPEIFTGLSEAESIKLFANAYLAMRVSYFNELDTYAELKNLDTRSIIRGVCADPRICDDYNNPSFGYGGYCFPKDTKQLLSNYMQNIPAIHQKLISAIVESNDVRKQHILHSILARLQEISHPVIGIYRLTMKSGSDNFRESAILDIIVGLKSFGYNIIIYEPTIGVIEKFQGFDVVKDLNEFKNTSSLIIANRYNAELNDVKQKVYTRDIFLKN